MTKLQKMLGMLIFLAHSLWGVGMVSILIPCHYSHFPLLEPLLIAYANQTLVPNEVVISLSEYRQLSHASILALEEQAWPFKLILLKQEKKCCAALNRKYAAAASSGDLLMFQDADDLPHPQRVEIVKFLFDHYRIDHLIHSFIREGEEFVPYNMALIPVQRTEFNFLITGIPIAEGEFIPLHNGNCSVSRQAIRLGAWQFGNEPGEDLHFNMSALSRFPRSSYVTPLGLIAFRTRLSYFSNTPPDLR